MAHELKLDVAWHIGAEHVEANMLDHAAMLVRENRFLQIAFTNPRLGVGKGHIANTPSPFRNGGGIVLVERFIVDGGPVLTSIGEIVAKGGKIRNRGADHEDFGRSS